MAIFEILLGAYVAVVTPLAGFLISSRLKRVETDVSELRQDMAQRFLRQDHQIAELRSEMRQEFGAVRHEMRQESLEIRQELAAQRSDLTQVALAVGARRETSSEVSED